MLRAGECERVMHNEKIDWTGVKTRRVRHKKGTIVFAQGDACQTVLHIEQGNVRLSVVSHAGKEAIVALLEAGHFFGEGCLAGQPLRMATATAVTACTVVEIEKQELTRQILARPELAQRFLTHMLTRNVRIEEDLIDLLFNDAEKRLARTLLLMARYGEEQASHRTLPRVSQTILAEMIGTTRSRVNAFMTKFRKLGFIDYNGTLKVHNSLLTVLLRDAPSSKSGATAAPSTAQASQSARH
jgi:CRP/FNR family cyclic AMP-dependent transcriptional regulator